MGEVAAVPETPAPAVDNRHPARIPSAVAQNEGCGFACVEKTRPEKAMNDNESGPPVKEHDPTANKKERRRHNQP